LNHELLHHLQSILSPADIKHRTVEWFSSFSSFSKEPNKIWNTRAKIVKEK